VEVTSSRSSLLPRPHHRLSFCCSLYGRDASLKAPSPARRRRTVARSSTVPSCCRGRRICVSVLDLDPARLHPVPSSGSSKRLHQVSTAAPEPTPVAQACCLVWHSSAVRSSQQRTQPRPSAEACRIRSRCSTRST
jgi:hypothetical protein